MTLITVIDLLSCYNLYNKIILDKKNKIFDKNTNDDFLKDNGKLIDIIQHIYYKNDLYIKVLYNFIIYKYLFNQKLKYEDDKKLKKDLRKILIKIKNEISTYYKNIPILLQFSIKYYTIFMDKCKEKLLQTDVRQELIDNNDKLFIEYNS